MASEDRYLELHGDFRALLSLGHELVTVSVHPEGRPAALARVDTDKATLTEASLPQGGVALAADADALFVAGADGHIYRSPRRGGAPKPLTKVPLDPPPRDLALLHGGRLAAVSGAAVAVLSCKNGRELERLELPDEGKVAAADPAGRWLAVGTRSGTLAVFGGEDPDRLLAAQSAKIHEGRITALLFERDEPRVLSIGADHKLLSTHVRGRLEPEDRGGKHMHEEVTPALVDGPGERFYTAGEDGKIKAWMRGSGRLRPATVSDGVPKTVAMAIVEHRGRPHLALAGEDATLRLLPLDAGGKVGELAVVYHGALARARHEFFERDVGRREAALRRLADCGDAASLALLAERARLDSDHGMKVLAAKLLGEAEHPRARGDLEKLLRAPEEAVLRAAFEGLRRHAGERDRRPLELALKTRKADVGKLAIDALSKLARKDDQARALLVRALENGSATVRFAALYALEDLGDRRSPAADLEALATKKADIRLRALARFFERGFLEHRAVETALRRLGEDRDADVRSTAFLVSVLSRPKLAQALRCRDAEIHRQLWDLETRGKDEKQKGDLPKAKKLDVKKLGVPDFRPLLEAMASRALDTSLRGTRGLAHLGDPRAFGALLQLSRDPQTSARVEAAKALQVLGDDRAADRLRRMLSDADGQVRDAAFTALARLRASAPLETCEAGLATEQEDVRRRALAFLVRQIKKKAVSTGSAAARLDLEDPALLLLGRTLNDPSRTVRGEAWKAVLNLSPDALLTQEALRFAQRSVHTDVRQDILVEVEAQIREPWAWPFLLELFADPAPVLRRQAFEFATKKSQGRQLEPYAAALRGPYADLRVRAAEALARRRTEGARELLETALDDADANVRRLAVEALLVDEAADVLRPALKSAYVDVRLRAAVARARLGDAAALEPLLALAALPRPGTPEAEGTELEVADSARWLEYVEAALDGLAHLAFPEAVPALCKLLEHETAPVRRAAAGALAWCSRPGALETLREALRHDDDGVRSEAAWGLAVCGDPSGAPVIFASGLDGARLFLAAVGLSQPAQDAPSAGDPAAADRVLGFLDHSEKKLRGRALLFHLLAAWAEGGGLERCLSMLSSAHPRVRLTAARALECAGREDAFAALLVEIFNDRGDHAEAWTVEADVLSRLAGLFLHADPQLRVRAAQLLEHRDAEKQETFDRAWRLFEARFGESFGPVPNPPPSRAKEDLEPLVFGAYAGLARLEGEAAGARVRQTAVARLIAMAQREGGWIDSVRPVLVLAMSDPRDSVRRLAFAGLEELGTAAEILSAEALASPHHDVGVLGLKLLAQASGKKAEAVLRQVLVERTDRLELETLRLLGERVGEVEASKAALDAASQLLRNEAVDTLARLRTEGDKKAGEVLRAALQSRFLGVRFQAARKMVLWNDAAAFPVLVEILSSDDGARQRSAIRDLARLGDERSPGALLDRIDHDPAGTALVAELLLAAGAYRQPATVDRLLGFLEDKKTRSPAFASILAVSGHDQKTKSKVDSLEWKAELARQHPRRDDVLKRLLEAVYPLGDEKLLGDLIQPARRAESPELGPALEPLTRYPKDAVRRNAVAALGWRLRKRAGTAEPLVEALTHGDPETRFLAAEGLARVGRRDGLAVLLASVELLEKLPYRRRAVAALGRLADPRALDPLLRLADEDGHALQEEAAEALGHMSEGDQAERIFDKLKSLAGGSKGRGVAARALRGLRWFGSRDAWRLILERAEDSDAWIRSEVAQLLGHLDDPAAREALEKRVLHDDIRPVAQEAAKSLRRLAGDNSLEPDYVLARSPFPLLEPETLERLAQDGDPGRLLSYLGEISREREDDGRALAAALLERSPLPLAAAAEHLESRDAVTVAAAARILGRGGEGSAAHREVLARVTRQTRERFAQEMLRALREDEASAELAELAVRLEGLIWACGRLGTGGEEVARAAGSQIEGTRVEGTSVEDISIRLRRAALLELAQGLGDASALEALEVAARSRHAELRAIAADGLRRRFAERARELVTSSLDDPGTLSLLLADAEDGAADALRGGLGNVHTQGVVLPYLMRQGDVDGLAGVARDRELPENTRLGALEGLARLGVEAAEAPLVAVGSSEDEEESLRKAAWRALRRSRRLRARTQLRESP